MASSKTYMGFIMDQLSVLGDITNRYMMGEYILYYKGVIFGGIYDDRLLVKETITNKKYNMKEVIPYKNSKPMYLVDDVDNIDILESIVVDTYDGLTV